MPIKFRVTFPELWIILLYMLSVAVRNWLHSRSCYSPPTFLSFPALVLMFILTASSHGLLCLSVNGQCKFEWRHCLYSLCRLADGVGWNLNTGSLVCKGTCCMNLYTHVGVLVVTDTAAHVENTCVCQTGKFMLGVVYGFSWEGRYSSPLCLSSTLCFMSVVLETFPMIFWTWSVLVSWAVTPDLYLWGMWFVYQPVISYFAGSYSSGILEPPFEHQDGTLNWQQIISFQKSAPFAYCSPSALFVWCSAASVIGTKLVNNQRVYAHCFASLCFIVTVASPPLDLWLKP